MKALAGTSRWQSFISPPHPRIISQRATAESESDWVQATVTLCVLHQGYLGFQMQSKLSSVFKHRKQAELIKQSQSTISAATGRDVVAVSASGEKNSSTPVLDRFQKLACLPLRVYNKGRKATLGFSQGCGAELFRGLPYLNALSCQCGRELVTHS